MTPRVLEKNTTSLAASGEFFYDDEALRVAAYAEVARVHHFVPHSDAEARTILTLTDEYGAVPLGKDVMDQQAEALLQQGARLAVVHNEMQAYVRGLMEYWRSSADQVASVEEMVKELQQRGLRPSDSIYAAFGDDTWQQQDNVRTALQALGWFYDLSGRLRTRAAGTQLQPILADAELADAIGAQTIHGLQTQARAFVRVEQQRASFWLDFLRTANDNPYAYHEALAGVLERERILSAVLMGSDK